MWSKLVYYRPEYRANGGTPEVGVYKVLECTDEINQQIELKEEM